MKRAEKSRRRGRLSLSRDAGTKESRLDPRFRIAVWVLAGSALILIGAMAAAIFTPAANARGAASDKVFTLLVPLIGSWIATILAFYFAEKNLIAATKSVTDAASAAAALGGGGVGSTKRVKDIMVPIGQMTYLQLNPPNNPTPHLLSEIRSRMSSAAVRRLPILAENHVVRYILHGSLIESFLADPAVTAPASSASLEDLLTYPKYAKLATAIGFVKEDDTMDTVRATMRAVEGSNDVFVTKNGRADSPVMGWVTNTLLATL